MVLNCVTSASVAADPRSSFLMVAMLKLPVWPQFWLDTTLTSPVSVISAAVLIPAYCSLISVASAVDTLAVIAPAAALAMML